jgi:two-component system, sensor histidine kinase and response regulator
MTLDSAGPADPCAVEAAVLAELVSQVGDDDPDAFRAELIGSYLAEARGQIARFVTATGDGDAESARAIAHSLRSASALLGAAPLARLLTHAEDVAVHTPADLAVLAEPVQAEFARVERAFNRSAAIGDSGVVRH